MRRTRFGRERERERETESEAEGVDVAVLDGDGEVAEVRRSVGVGLEQTFLFEEGVVLVVLVLVVLHEPVAPPRNRHPSSSASPRGGGSFAAFYKSDRQELSSLLKLGKQEEHPDISPSHCLNILFTFVLLGQVYWS